jgi:hypothetical protein
MHFLKPANLSLFVIVCAFVVHITKMTKKNDKLLQVAKNAWISRGMTSFVCHFAVFFHWVKTNSTPVVHIKIAGIHGCSSL